ncbi:MAG: DUF1361 domain-containing protein [Lewinellaceae bacterium]|nr:DUF1361 domain-containing protein [Lewinellaceae bacterium]
MDSKLTSWRNWLYIQSVFNLGLIGVRVAWAHWANVSPNSLFLFLIWNLFLAWIPVWFSSRLTARQPGLLSLGLFMGWLVFLPNAPYLLTDLIHLRERPPIPLWFDGILFFSFAWTGLALGLWSLLRVEQQLRIWWPQHRRSYTGLWLFLAGLGVFCGRFLRWNSWELITNPRGLLSDAVQLLTHWEAYRGELILIPVVGAVLLLIHQQISCLFKPTHHA